MFVLMLALSVIGIAPGLRALPFSSSADARAGLRHDCSILKHGGVTRILAKLCAASTASMFMRARTFLPMIFAEQEGASVKPAHYNGRYTDVSAVQVLTTHPYLNLCFSIISLKVVFELIHFLSFQSSQ